MLTIHSPLWRRKADLGSVSHFLGVEVGMHIRAVHRACGKVQINTFKDRV